MPVLPIAQDAMIEFGHLSHCGLRRTLNEDTYYGDADLGLWLVADGMGGHDNGEIASAIARDCVAREVRDGSPLTQAITIAGEEILRQSRGRSDTLPMGTTVVAALLRNAQFEIAWVGDSRAYLWHAGKLTQLSHDHSYVQDLIAQGMLTNEEARQHPQRKMVTQALGVTSPAQLDVARLSGSLRPGTQILLCSDGLTEEVDDPTIAEILSRPGVSAQECADTLVAAALDGGGSDNITVLVLRVD